MFRNVLTIQNLFTKCNKFIYLQARLKHNILNQSVIVAKEYCTNNGPIHFETPAVKMYLNNLVLEYKTLKTVENTRVSESKRLLELQNIVGILEERETLKENVKTLKELIMSDASTDEKFNSTVKEEQESYNERIKDLECMLFTALVPCEPEDHCKDVLLEVSAGVGGQEAMLFAKELFDMYCSYVTYKEWHMQISQQDESDLGGLRHGSIQVSGEDVYQHLKYEAGVHRVQRVPSTEKSGRVHTSTVSVAVLTQPEEVDVILHEKDLRFETKRASGPGGQHVNKTESAVRVTHIPTGISVECQVDRSQIKNRQIALQTLKARLYHQELEEQTSKTRATRKQQVGLSMRSEKIRTYNFNQDRITDHRLGNNFHNMRGFLMGGELLDSLIHQLHQKISEKRLSEFLASLQA